MRWEQVDLELGTITVIRLKRGKTGNHTMDRDELRDLRKLRKQNTAAYVFGTERGGPMGRDTLAYIVREAGKAAGLGDHMHPHMLRHAAGYSMVNQGVDLRLIQDFLGHRSPQMTMLYTEVSPRRLAAVRVRQRNEIMENDVTATTELVGCEQTVMNRGRVSDFDELTAGIQACWVELGITDADFKGCENSGTQRTESKRRNLAVLRLRALEAGTEPLPANY